MITEIIKFFDKLEDRIRIRLSHWPILYAFIGAVGIILLWKGIWEWAELYPILFGVGSVVLGTVILLLTGLMVQFFIGDAIILSGMNREKKLVEKTEKEVGEEEVSIHHIVVRLQAIENKLDELVSKPKKVPAKRKITI